MQGTAVSTDQDFLDHALCPISCQSSLRRERAWLRSAEHPATAMLHHRSKTLRRAFPWRETFLAALRRDPQVKLACKAAGISRNTAYTHLRRDARFRRQWEHALIQGEDAAYCLHLKKLATDPQYLRTLERLRLAYGSEGRPKIGRAHV